MEGFADDHRRRRRSPEITIGRCTVSFISAILTQLSLLFIPHFFPRFSLLFHFFLSGLVLVLAIGFGRFCRRLLGIRGSAPAFVFAHIVFLWLVYVAVIRRDVSPSTDIIFNGELALLLIGFFRILGSDPGFVRDDSSAFVNLPPSHDGAHSEELPLSIDDISPSTEVAMKSIRTKKYGIFIVFGTSLSSSRVRYCRSCEAYVRGFDHHCPAFGNCIGQKNYVLFMTLLVGFITTEVSYAMCCYRSDSWTKIYKILNTSDEEIYFDENLVLCTMSFALLQVLWQVVFLAWHIYCACFNIRTEEWINWRKYPEFHVIILPGQSVPNMRFRNPYDKGILCNLKDCWLPKE